MAITELIVTNKWSENVTLYLTLGVGSNMLSAISKIPFITDVVNPHQGSVVLAPNASVTFTPPKDLALSGNVAFNTPPLNCPTPDLPMGVNLGEFTLNAAALGGPQSETIDISNVAGANSFIEFEFSGGGNWNAGTGYPDVKSCANKRIGDNVGVVGVYPYACTTCTGTGGAPVCPSIPEGAPQPPVPQTEAICNVQRNATEAGGTVTINFNGPIPELA